MKKNFLLFTTFAAALFSCASVDVEKSVKLEASASGGQRGGPDSAIIAVPVEPPPPQIVTIEQPVFVPEQKAVATQTVRGREAVEKSNSQGIKRPEDFSHAAMIYDYDRDWVYEVYCQPLRASDLRLEPGERALEPPFVADSERWMLGAGVSQEGGAQVQHIYVKPTDPGITASLIINTDRRVYHLILRSYSDVHMPLVYWRYPSSGLPYNFISGCTAQGSQSVVYNEDSLPTADPRFLSFNYKITYNFFKKPKWLPYRVYDDGNRTYIDFKKEIAQSAMPGVFENRSDVINYRVYGSLIIIDKLIEEITVSLESREITIKKKAGK
jgi:type IV secretion system protein VirB9